MIRGITRRPALPLPLPHDAGGRRGDLNLAGMAALVAALAGLVALGGVFAGKSQRLYPADGISGATLATEGVRGWMLLAFALAAAALVLLGLAVLAGRRGAAPEAALAAVLAALGFGGVSAVAIQRLAALSAEASRAAYDLTPGVGLSVVAWAAPVALVAALAYAILVRLGTQAA